MLSFNLIKKANKEYYDKISLIYDFKHDISTEDLPQFINDIKKLNSGKSFRGKKIIDIGCGTGRAAIKFALMGNHVTAADISGKILEKCKDNAEKIGLKLKFLKCDCDKIPLYNNSLDIVTCSASLHHFPDYQKTFIEFYRVLKKSGKLILIAEPKQSYLRPKFMRDIKEHISNRYDSQKIKISGKINPDVHIFNVNEIMASLKIIGFKNIKIQTFGCLTCAYRDTLYYILPKYFKKNLYNTFNLIDQKFFNYFPSNFHCLFNLIATK